MIKSVLTFVIMCILIGFAVNSDKKRAFPKEKHKIFAQPSETKVGEGKSFWSNHNVKKLVIYREYPDIKKIGQINNIKRKHKVRLWLDERGRYYTVWHFNDESEKFLISYFLVN